MLRGEASPRKPPCEDGASNLTIRNFLSLRVLSRCSPLTCIPDRTSLQASFYTPRFVHPQELRSIKNTLYLITIRFSPKHRVTTKKLRSSCLERWLRAGRLESPLGALRLRLACKTVLERFPLIRLLGYLVLVIHTSLPFWA